MGEMASPAPTVPIVFPRAPASVGARRSQRSPSMLVDPETQARPPEEPGPVRNSEHAENGALPTENGGLSAGAADDEEYTILVPTTDLSTAGRLIQVAAALMPVHEGEARGRVLPLGVVEIPEE